MKVRGLTILTRKMVVTRRFGADAWLGLYRDMARTLRCFRSLISPETLVPLSDYLTFHDELVRRFFRDDEASHLALGRESARWALTDGPCKAFLDHKDLRGFVGAFPGFWTTYFADTSSRSEATLTGDSVEFKTFDLPEWHPYFEHFVMGYMIEALELFCASPIGGTRLRGGSGNGYHYLLHAAPEAPERTPHPAILSAARPAAFETSRQLSDRELEVMLLVAEGKTNAEIGVVLGISGKTVQHHVARVYRKIDVTGRVGATKWLAQRGMLAGY